MMQSTAPSETDRREPPPAPKTLSGRGMVVAMFLFGLALTGGMWGYWKWHVAPFLPLQSALAAEFEDSRPLVEGGQEKMHRGTPRVLRVTMHVEFDPVKERERAEPFAERVYAFIREQADLSPYQQLDLYLFHRLGEEAFHEIRITWPLPEGDRSIEVTGRSRTR